MWLPAGSLASAIASLHSPTLVVPMACGDWLVTVQVTRSGWPLLAWGGAMTEETTRSAYGMGTTSKRLGASATLLASLPFSKTTSVASVRTNRCEWVWKLGGSRKDSLRE